MARLVAIYAFVLALLVWAISFFIYPSHKDLSLDPDFKLSSLFSENAVLQRKKPIKIFGTARPGSRIELNLAGKKSSTEAKEDGTWLITLSPILAGGPYQLKVTNKQTTIERNNIYVGDVWLAAGQSNIVWFVDSATNAEKNIAEANNYTNKIFFLNLSAQPSENPVSAFDFIPNEWSNTNSETVRSHPAIPYAFAREIYNDQKVPIGIIRAATSNTSIQAHMSKESLVAYKDLEKLQASAEDDRSIWYETIFHAKIPKTQLGYFVFCLGQPNQQQHFTTFFNDKKLINYSPGTGCHKLDSKSLNEVNKIEIRIYPKKLKGITVEELAAEFNKGKVEINGETLELNHWQVHNEISANTPSSNFDTKINPIILYPIKGILWYQGESNIDDSASYKQLFTALVNDWRERWKEELPFITVQLHKFKTDKPENLLKFREVQYELSRELNKVYLIDAFDLSDKDLNVHPKNKDEVGHRLAIMAKEKVY